MEPDTLNSYLRRPSAIDYLPNDLTPERILSAKQVAALWGVSVATVRRLDRAGKLPPAIRLSERRFGWRARDAIAALMAREQTPRAVA